ncbi:MAG: hypothetical protein IKT43_01915 [Clostridia bacterium]|nr:hypothetical protein [Clostridia bacterium]
MIDYRSAEDVKKAVRSALKNEGLTVAALGERLGLTQGNTSRLINRINPSFNAMRDLSAAIGYKLVFDIVPEEKEGEEDGEA